MHTLVFLPLRGAGLHMHEIVIIRVYFFNPPLFFYLLAHMYRSHLLTDFRGLWLKNVFSRHLRPFWGANKIFSHFLLFFAKKEKITMVKIGKTFKYA